jgi:8-amino-7-oxononanoate synthase
MDLTPADSVLAAELAQLDAADLRRHPRVVEHARAGRVTVNGREFVNFASNDYLGLATHPALAEACARAVREHGTGAGASRLISGTHALHHALEEAIADWKRTEAALLFSSGMNCALGTIPALVGRGDTVILDRLAHACLVDGARLSGSTLRVFAHNDLAQLAERLAWAANRGQRALVVTESVFSMDGDTAPLADIARLCAEHGAWLLVDEAHAAGVTGPDGAGLVAQLGIGAQVTVQMGTLGKALGAAGGYIAGSRTLVEHLWNRARTLMFSTAPSLADAAAARAGIALVRSPEGAALREQLAAHRREIAGPDHPSAIVPVILGAERAALEAARTLWERGLWVPAIRYPTVARGKARLRVSLSAAHDTADLARLRDALAGLKV